MIPTDPPREWVLTRTGVPAHGGGVVPEIQVMSLTAAQTIVPDLEATWAEAAPVSRRPFEPL